jgi:hypothetical protein
MRVSARASIRPPPLRREAAGAGAQAGFCIYYLFPLALLSMHFELILDIFVGDACTAWHGTASRAP